MYPSVLKYLGGMNELKNVGFSFSRKVPVCLKHYTGTGMVFLATEHLQNEQVPLVASYKSFIQEADNPLSKDSFHKS